MIGVYDYTVVLTYMSLISGVMGIIISVTGVGHPEIGIFFLMLSGVLDTFDGRVDQTVIAQRRDLSLELMLDAGSYIAIPSLKDKGVCTSFYLEFYFEDILLENTKNNEFNFNQLKNTKIKRLGEKVKCELINEYIASEMKMTSKNKLDFIISAFQYSLKNYENENKVKQNGINFNDSYEEEDF